jgi:putative hydrolase of the HAD superfamily
LGNVIIDFNHRIAAERISKFTNKTGQEIYDLFFDSKLTSLFEEGKISPQQFFLKVKEILNLKLNFDEFVPIWNEIFFLSEKNTAIYNLACTLKSHYRIALLSNINILHFEYIKKTFPVLNNFPNIITSYEAGFRKPHPEIYRIALKVLRVSAENCFYTDDRPELIEGARKLGIEGFVFKSVEQLEKDLLGSGVII